MATEASRTFGRGDFPQAPGRMGIQDVPQQPGQTPLPCLKVCCGQCSSPFTVGD